jgi:hypothetical protein
MAHEPEHARAPTSPRQADAIARGSGHWNLTTNHTVYLGDVDRRGSHSFPIFHLGSAAQGPRVESRLTGDPSIRLVRAPMFLPVSSHPYDETLNFQVDVDPQHQYGRRFESVLRIDVVDSPREQHFVQVVAESHAPGELTRHDKEQRDKRQRSEDAEQQRKARETKELEGRVAKDDQRDRHYHSQAEPALRDACESIARRFQTLLDLRISGVTAAETEASRFKRVVDHEPSALFQFAMAALQIASAGIGAALAHRLAPVFTSMFSRSLAESGPMSIFTKPPSDTLIAFLTESVEASVQTAAGHGISKLERRPDIKGSADSLAEFFRVERDSLIKDNATRADAAGHRMVRLLRPAFEGPEYSPQWPKGTRAIVEGMMETASKLESEAKNASTTQMHESVKGWVNYVEVNGWKGRSPTSLRDRSASVDGLVDVTFAAEQANATGSVTVTHARLNGVRQAVVKRFTDIPLAQTGLAMRASCQFSPEQAVIVYREASGAVRYTDTPAEAGSWLAHKAGVRARPKEEDKARGARLLVDEIARKSLQQHLTGAIPINYDAYKFVENDSDEPEQQ